MNEKTKTGIEILEASILLGIVGDALLRTHWGLNIFLWVSLLVTAMIAVTIRHNSNRLNPKTLALHGALVFFAAMFVWRDSVELHVLNILAMLSILTVLTLPALRVKVHIAGAYHYVIAACWSAISVAFAPLVLLAEDIKWQTLPKVGFSKQLLSVGKGLAIATPIIILFGALFMAADAVFQGIVENTLRINPDLIFTHIALFGFIAWVVAGYLRASTFEVSSITEMKLSSPEIKPQVPSVTLHTSEDAKKKDANEKEKESKDSNISSKDAPKQQKKKEKVHNKKPWDWRKFDNKILPGFFTLGAIEIGIVLGLMNLLFLGFVIVQIPYLFGGMDLVQTTPDFKLAEYARRGFGELVTVSALVLPILLLSHWLLRKDKPINERIYRVLAGIQIALLFVIMISATQRLLLLTGNLGYGLTTGRLYPMMFMILLALIFAWFAMTVLRGMRQQFAWGALWTALFMVATLHVLNPDDFIVRTNVRLMQQGRAFDANYNSSLSDDAIPAVSEALDLMNSEQKCAVKWNLSDRSNSAAKENDFRSWNYSRWQAKVLLWGNSDLINTEGCLERQRERFLDDY